MIIARLSEALPIPVPDAWDRQLWESARSKDLVVDLQTSGDCQGGYQVQLTEAVWKKEIDAMLQSALEQGGWPLHPISRTYP